MPNDVNASPKSSAAGEAHNLTRPANKINSPARVARTAPSFKQEDRKSSEYRCDSCGAEHGFRPDGGRFCRPPQPVVGKDGSLRCPTCEQELRDDAPPDWKWLRELAQRHPNLAELFTRFDADKARKERDKWQRRLGELEAFRRDLDGSGKVKTFAGVPSFD